MATTSECTLQVGIADLLAAIRAVIPHADKPKLGDDALTLARVRFSAGADELLGREVAEALVGARDEIPPAREIGEFSRIPVPGACHPSRLAGNGRPARARRAVRMARTRRRRPRGVEAAV